MSRMSHKEILDLIAAIEKGFPVNDIVYRSVRLWPYIRKEIALSLMSESTQHTPVSERTKSFRYWISYFRNEYKKVRGIRKQLETLNRYPGQVKSADYLIISNADIRTVRSAGYAVSPFIDSMGHYLSKKGECRIMEFSRDADFGTKGMNPVYYLDEIQCRAKFRFEVRRSLLGSFKRAKVAGYSEFLRYLSTLKTGFAMPEEMLIEKVEFLFALKEQFIKLFSRLKPKAVFFAVYFQEYCFAVSLACRELNINSVELQHGQQGEVSPFNTGFSVVPEEGYELMPATFWVWGNKSKERKKGFINRTGHRAVVGGNTWVSLWLNGNEQTKGLKLDFPASLFAAEKKVLVALQHIPDPVPSFLKEAIRRSGKDTRWYFRLHPYYLKDMDAIRKELEGLENVELEFANKLPLYQLLKEVDCIITHWSTVAYEALAFNVHPLIISKNGKDLMGDYIEKGLFSFALDAEGVLSVVNGLKQKPRVEETEKFMETDEKVIFDAIAEVTGNK